MAITGGPAKDFKWGGSIYAPTDGELAYDFSGTDFESKMSGNGNDVYAEGKPRVGYVEQEVAMTASEFKALKSMQDGVARSGTVTCPNGDVLSVNGALEGELALSNGKVKIKIAGKVRLQ